MRPARTQDRGEIDDSQINAPTTAEMTQVMAISISPMLRPMPLHMGKRISQRSNLMVHSRIERVPGELVERERGKESHRL
ncbi:hypothetical protein B2K11_12210 [Microbacterium sp. B35-30]|nr:hypothetical protein B2K11_12210 [Microbacterium sp. B35-30]